MFRPLPIIFNSKIKRTAGLDDPFWEQIPSHIGNVKERTFYKLTISHNKSTMLCHLVPFSTKFPNSR